MPEAITFHRNWLCHAIGQAFTIEDLAQHRWQLRYKAS